MKASLFLLTLLTMTVASYGQEEVIELMTPEQIRSYMSAYDETYDQTHDEMSAQVEEGLLLGRLRLNQVHFCRDLETKKKEAVAKLDDKAQNYHQQLGRVDGLWDGRKEGCLEAYALMQQRLELYESDLRHRWNDGVEIGQMVAILKLELFGESLDGLARSCLNTPIIQGIVDTFLKDKVKSSDRLSAIQSDCQGQARELVALLKDIEDGQRLAQEPTLPAKTGTIHVYGSPSQRLPASGGAESR